jgi:hypothetical protein
LASQRAQREERETRALSVAIHAVATECSEPLDQV